MSPPNERSGRVEFRNHGVRRKRTIAEVGRSSKRRSKHHIRSACRIQIDGLKIERRCAKPLAPKSSSIDVDLGQTEIMNANGNQRSIAQVRCTIEVERQVQIPGRVKGMRPFWSYSSRNRSGKRLGPCRLAHPSLLDNRNLRCRACDRIEVTERPEDGSDTQRPRRNIELHSPIGRIFDETPIGNWHAIAKINRIEDILVIWRDTRPNEHMPAITRLQ